MTTTRENFAIASFQWGQIVDAEQRIFKDARLFPGGVEEWDWRKTGTRHNPGIQIADLEDLLATKPDVVILSRGVDLVLQVPQATIDFARAHATTVLVLQSEQAVTEYNRRIAHERVVALIHSTC
ncbi:MAG TPA: MTH938/NDUFAF3 family protein [Kofleriaceae bacterium]|nr:MTH938/NDUFAF3 family protein [Kofleriaceae bacterium]